MSEIMSEKSGPRPEYSRAPSSFDPFSSRAALPLDQARPRRAYKSSRLHGDHPKPWLQRFNKRALWGTAILYTGALIGTGIGVFLSWRDLQQAPLAQFCDVPFWEDDFATLDSEKWSREVRVDGFGTGSFDWTTTDDKNAYVDEQGLHIVPTLTTESTNITDAELYNGYTVNLTSTGGDGSCTAPEDWKYNKACSIASNTTLNTIINPVRSARLSTKNSLKMTYGKIEVIAKLPKGDWLWPAIWMMPVDDAYGPWPLSGEIDIMESRGNDPGAFSEGRDVSLSTIHWGPNALLDSYWRKTMPGKLLRSDFSKGFHKFGIEWTPNYMLFYFDNKLRGTLYTKFGGKHGDMWEQGKFQGSYVNGSNVDNPWDDSPNPNAPFDKDFYLILNVAVGGTNGFFYDGACFTPESTGQRYCSGDKPWRNDSPRAMLDFWNGRNSWLPTWGEGDKRGMTVKSVKAYKYGGC